MKNTKKEPKNWLNIIWWIAIVLEWIVIPVYMACIGYEINILQKLREWEHINTFYYIIGLTDALLFYICSLIFRKRKYHKEELPKEKFYIYEVNYY